MSQALGSVFGSSGLGGLLGTALNVGGMLFPPLGIANAACNLLTGGIGQGIGQAVGQLCSQFGMPNFVGDMVKQLAGSVLGGMQLPTDRGCTDHVGSHEGFQNSLQDFVQDLANRLVEQTRKNMESEHGGGGGEKCKGKGKGAGSWLEAIAKAMGEIAGDKAAQLVDLSEQMSKLNADGTQLATQLKGTTDDQQRGNITSEQGKNAKEFSEVQARFQSASQEYSLLQNTFSNAIKSIGEGLTTMGRKG